MPEEKNMSDGSERTAVGVIRSLVAAQLRNLSWTPERDPDWRSFADGFWPGARLIPAARLLAPQAIESFIARRDGLRSAGKRTSFEQTLLGCEVDVFGKVAVAMAACEMLENRAKVTRDVSAFVLAQDEGVWRMVTMAWDMETEARSVLAHAARQRGSADGG
jgi:hypothetical protein